MSSTPFRERRLLLSADLLSVTHGRHFVRDTLLEWDLARLVEDAELGVSELIANAVRHARTDVTLSISAADRVTISIADGEPMLHRPFVPLDEDFAESGRGLKIVAAVSDDWGIEARAGGKAVWFSLMLPDSATADADLFSLHRPAPAAGQAEGSSKAGVG
ncbi:ATP-binding protein [Sporichthya polymorpha]|uniref:ATP-binding protein n=1 Tax=Sporichthya polymorpha TaxID=35751 RepID=UPI000370DDC7|nr:ATP-binding protein [Sporichthya polymorpha]